MRHGLRNQNSGKRSVCPRFPDPHRCSGGQRKQDRKFAGGEKSKTAPLKVTRDAAPRITFALRYYGRRLVEFPWPPAHCCRELMKRPRLDPKYLKSKLPSRDSASRSLPVQRDAKTSNSVIHEPCYVYHYCNGSMLDES